MQHCYFIPVYIAPLAGTYPFSSVCFNEFKTLKESLDLHRMSTMGGKKKKIKVDSSLKKRKKKILTIACVNCSAHSWWDMKRVLTAP